MLHRTVGSLGARGLTDITIIDNDSAEPLSYSGFGELFDADIKIRWSDNQFRQMAPWLIEGLLPTDSYYIVQDCDVALDCPEDVAEVMIRILEENPEVPKVGLGIRTDTLLFPPPQHYGWSYLMEYSVENGQRYHTIREPHYSVDRIGDSEVRGTFMIPEVIDAPTDTHWAMYRPGHGWPGIVGARTKAPYLCRHLPWENPEYTDEEKLYYSRAGAAWTMGHSAGTLLDTTVVVPFTELRAETAMALTDSGEQFRLRPMANDSSYFELFEELWKDGRSFIIIEHDIVVNETTIDELKVCDHDWCAMPFNYRGEEKAYALACSRFSADLIARVPQLPDIVAKMSDDSHPPMHWCRLDAWVYHALTTMGERRHEHSRAEPLRHIGPQVPKHGCVA